jgi:acylphosphatase
MQREASSRGLTGWVRNLPDGRVEAVVEGSADEIEQLIAWCHQGPAGSRVSDVQVLEETPTGIEDFAITY